MKFSLWTSNARPWSEILDLATYADATGWHSLWYADHFMSQTPDDAPGDAPALECWSMLAAVAAAHGFRLPDVGERVTHFIECQVIRHLG